MFPACCRMGDEVYDDDVKVIGRDGPVTTIGQPTPPSPGSLLLLLLLLSLESRLT